MSAPTSERDVAIAEVLDTIPIPEHRPTFWADLHRKLDAETADIPPEVHQATVTSIAPAKLPAHAPGNPRLDTGDLPSVRTLTHERTRRRARAPWLAIAAGLLVLAGAVGVVTFAGDRSGDDSADLADGPVDTTPTESAAADPDTETTTTLAPSSPTTTVVAPIGTADAAVESWFSALGQGDTATAAAALGPRSLAYLQAVGADPVGMMTESQEGYGAWADAPDAQVTSASVGAVQPLGAELAIVSIRGTYPGEGGGARVDVVPVVRDPDGWHIEHLAHQADRDNRLIFTVPDLNDDGTLAPISPGDDINVFVPSSGTVYFLLDGAPPVAKATTPVGRNDDPFALYNPDQDLAAGPHELIVVAVGDDGTITSYAGAFQVEG